MYFTRTLNLMEAKAAQFFELATILFNFNIIARNPQCICGSIMHSQDSTEIKGQLYEGIHNKQSYQSLSVHNFIILCNVSECLFRTECPALLPEEGPMGPKCCIKLQSCVHSKSDVSVCKYPLITYEHNLWPRDRLFEIQTTISQRLLLRKSSNEMLVGVYQREGER